MMARTSDSEIRPLFLNTFGIPNDEKLLTAYRAFKPTVETLTGLYELNRTIFPELFIENNRLGTLGDLSVRCLAKEFHVPISYHIKNDPLKMRIHYDTLSIDLPLEDCVDITDQLYWKRMVLSKSTDKMLALKKNYNWKGHALSLKYVELVEKCPAEYWPEEQMHELAMKVKNHITFMHIRQLQCLSDWAFRHQFEPEKKEEEDDQSGFSSDIKTPSFSSEFSEEGEEEEGEEEEEEEYENYEHILDKPADAVEYDNSVDEEKATRRAQRQQILRAKHAQVLRRKRREERRLKLEEELAKKPVKKRRTRIKDVFNIEIEEDPKEDDPNLELSDKRNPEKYLERKKRYKYPAEDCHHVDLSFVRWFEFLTELTIEIRGPNQDRGFQTRSFNFSSRDIKNLAFGIHFLPRLTIFRFRNSRMDARKFSILAHAVHVLANLRIVDFGYNQLQDDCGDGIMVLFNGTESIRTVILDGNYLGVNAMHALAGALGQYKGLIEFLSLAGNPLGDEGVHVFVTGILELEHCPKLSLRAVCLSQEGFLCCIVNELMYMKPNLRDLDIVAIQLEPETGLALMKAVSENTTLLHLDVRGCNLSYKLENDIAILMRRNQFILDNPYIGDWTKTEAEIKAMLGRLKNPILIDALKAVKAHKACLDGRPDDTRRWSEPVEAELPLQEPETFVKPQSLAAILYPIGSTDTYRSVCQGPFDFPAPDFSEELFLRHIQLPGTGERYFYFKKLRQRGSCLEDLHNDE